MQAINFKKMGRIILIVFISISFSGCLFNQCPSTKSLGPVNCEVGYITVSGSKYIQENDYWLYQYGKEVIINDLQLYKNSFVTAPDSMPFGWIDFSTHTLLVFATYDYNGDSANSDGRLCFNPSTGKWMFKVEFTHSGDCESDGRPFMSVVIAPKIPAGAVIEFNVRNINY